MADQVSHDPQQAADDGHGHPFWPTHVLDELMILYGVVGIVLTLAILRPFGLHGMANPLQTPEGIKPEWYFLATYQSLKYVPKVVGVVGMGVFFTCMFIWPWLDPLFTRVLRRSRSYLVVGWAVMIIFVSLTSLGWICERTVHVAGHAISFDIKAIPHLDSGAEQPEHKE